VEGYSQAQGVVRCVYLSFLKKKKLFIYNFLFLFTFLKVEAHYLTFLHGSTSRGLFFSFSNGGAISISESTITRDTSTSPTSYSFLTITGGSSLILSAVNVTNLLFGSVSTVSLINCAGTSTITILGSTFTNISSGGSSGAIFTDGGSSGDKTVNLLINGSSFTNISTSSVATGIVITMVGGGGSSLIVHTSNFTTVFTTVSTGLTLGGGIFVNDSSFVELDGNIFSQIQNVSSGGGLYVGNSGSVLISGCVFTNIPVRTSGGMMNIIINIFFFFYLWLYTGFYIIIFN
jgi:hypothetical protein